MLCRKDIEATSGFRCQRNQQVEKGGATSGKVRSNKWKKDGQQVENDIATGGIVRNATSGYSQITRQNSPARQPDSQTARYPDSQIARQPDGWVQPGNQEVGKLESWKVVRKLERQKVEKQFKIG